MMTTENFVAAVILISIIVGFLCFGLGYFYSRTRIENAALNAKTRAIEAEIKFRELQTQKMSRELDNLSKELNNLDNLDKTEGVEIFKVSSDNQKQLEELLSKLAEKETNDKPKNK